MITSKSLKISQSRFIANISEYLDYVESTKGSIIITRKARPILLISPYADSS